MLNNVSLSTFIFARQTTDTSALSLTHALCCVCLITRSIASFFSFSLFYASTLESDK